MTRVQFDITVPRPVDEVYDYVADFRNLPEWDPGIVSSEQTSGSGIEVGSTYRVTSADRPARVVVEGDGSSVHAVDEIRFEEADGGTRIHYTADFTLKGLLGPVAPFLKPAFERLAAKSRDGLSTRLSD